MTSMWASVCMGCSAIQLKHTVQVGRMWHIGTLSLVLHSWDRPICAHPIPTARLASFPCFQTSPMMDHSPYHLPFPLPNELLAAGAGARSQRALLPGQRLLPARVMLAAAAPPQRALFPFIMPTP